jgi:chorismate dehydratase
MSMTTQKIHIGRVPFLVCLPYYHHHLRKNGLFWDGAPSQLNTELIHGRIHAAPTSSITYAQSADILQICPHLCTASALEIHSVLVCSQIPLEELDHKNVLLSNESATSNALFKILCSQYLKIKPEFVQAQQGYMAQVLIGDQALKARKSQQWKYVYELDSLWRAWKGTPFVFGLWLVNTSALLNSKMHRDFVEYYEQVRDAVQSFPQHAEQALFDWEAHYGLPLPYLECKAFLERIDYALTEERIGALEQFYQAAAQEGLIPSAPKIKIFNL